MASHRKGLRRRGKLLGSDTPSVQVQPVATNRAIVEASFLCIRPLWAGISHVPTTSTREATRVQVGTGLSHE